MFKFKRKGYLDMKKAWRKLESNEKDQTSLGSILIQEWSY